MDLLSAMAMKFLMLFFSAVVMTQHLLPGLMPSAAAEADILLLDKSGTKSTWQHLSCCLPQCGHA
jgi:hypothetical protein